MAGTPTSHLRRSAVVWRPSAATSAANDILAGAALALIVAGAPLLGARAEDAHAEEWNGSVGFATDNVYRGLSLNNGRAAWLADLHAQFDADWIAGLAAGAARPSDRTPGAEISIYLDRRWQLDADWSAKLGVLHHDWPGSRWREALSYDELTAAVGYRGRWSLSVALSPDTTGVYSRSRSRTGFAGSLELGAHQPLIDRLVADFGLGYADRSHTGDDDYVYVSAGLSYGFGDAYVVASRIWVDHAPTYFSLENSADQHESGRWLAALLWTF